MMSVVERPLRGHGEQAVFVVSGRFAIGGTGAVGAKVGASHLSLTRDNAGLYTLQLLGSEGAAAGVPAILHADAKLLNADTDASNDTDAHAAMVTDIDDSDGTISIACVDEAMVVREAPSGSIIMVRVEVKLSSVVR